MIIYLLILIFLAGLYFYAKCGGNREGLTNSTKPSSKPSGTPRCPDMLIQQGSKILLYNSKLTRVPGVNPIEFNNLEEYTEFLDWQKSQGIICPVLYLQQSYDAQGNKVYKVRPSVTEPQGGLPPSSTGPQSQSQSLPQPLIASQPQTATQPQTASQQQMIALQNSGQPQPTQPSPQSSQTYQKIPPLTSHDTNPSKLVDATQSDQPYNKNSYPAYDQTSYYVGTTTPLDKMNEKEAGMLYSPNPMDDNWGGTDYTQSLVDSGYYKNNEVQSSINN